LYHHLVGEKAKKHFHDGGFSLFRTPEKQKNMRKEEEEKELKEAQKNLFVPSFFCVQHSDLVWERRRK